MIPAATPVPTVTPLAVPSVVPTAVGYGDGWGADDTGIVVGLVILVIVAAGVLGAVVPQHGGRVTAWRIFGRAPNGLAMITTALNAGMAVFLFRGVATGAGLQGPVGVALGAVAAASALALVIGWWVHRLRHWMSHGLLLSVAVWGGICGTNWAAGNVVSTWISACLTGLYVYAWLAEVTDIGGEAGAR